MLSQNQVEYTHLLNSIAEEFKRLDYSELREYANECEKTGNPIVRELLYNGNKISAYVTIASIGRFRKRCSIEIILDAEIAAGIPCVYFERFESGRLIAFDPPWWAIFTAVSLLLIVGIIIIMRGFVSIYHRILG